MMVFMVEPLRRLTRPTKMATGSSQYAMVP